MKIFAGRLQQQPPFLTLIYSRMRQCGLVTDGGEDMRCDAKTFAQMYKTVYVDLYRFALCMMQNQQEAEDGGGSCL